MSKVDRRKFIGTVVAAGTAVAAGSNAIGQMTPRTRRNVGRDALARLGFDSFLPFVNTDFTFGLGRNAVRLVLIDAQDTRGAGSMARKLDMEQFILSFSGDFRRPLTQNTYKVSHFGLGDFDLFITEGGRRGRLNVYHAVINRVTVSEDQI